MCVRVCVLVGGGLNINHLLGWGGWGDHGFTCQCVLLCLFGLGLTFFPGVRTTATPLS